MKLFFVFIITLSADGYGFTTDRLRVMVTKAEIDYTLPPGLLDAIVQQESNYRIFADNLASNKGVRVSSYGLGQLTLESAKHHCKLAKRYIHHPRKNIRCAAKIIDYQLTRYKGNIGRAVAAYNWGTPCECNGKVFKQKLRKLTRVCKKKLKGKNVPIRCKKRGTFLNQNYVDSVLQKRKASIREDQQVLLSSMPEEADGYIVTMFRELRHAFF